MSRSSRYAMMAGTFANRGTHHDQDGSTMHTSATPGSRGVRIVDHADLAELTFSRRVQALEVLWTR